jgi:hypothetical protein
VVAEEEVFVASGEALENPRPRNILGELAIALARDAIEPRGVSDAVGVPRPEDKDELELALAKLIVR